MRPLRKPVAANPAHKSEGGRRMAGDGVAPRGSVAPREERFTRRPMEKETCDRSIFIDLRLRRFRVRLQFLERKLGNAWSNEEIYVRVKEKGMIDLFLPTS